MGLTWIGKALLIWYGILAIIALTSHASGGESGSQIFNNSLIFIFGSAIALYLIDWLFYNKIFDGDHLLVLWKRESNNYEEKKRKQEERQRQQRRTQEKTNEFENLQSPHEILGISPDATQEEIKARFRELSIKFHPDKEKGVFADELMKKINWAYDELKT